METSNFPGVIVARTVVPGFKPYATPTPVPFKPVSPAGHPSLSHVKDSSGKTQQPSVAIPQKPLTREQQLQALLYRLHIAIANLESRQVAQGNAIKGKKRDSSDDADPADAQLRRLRKTLQGVMRGELPSATRSVGNQTCQHLLGLIESEAPVWHALLSDLPHVNTSAIATFGALRLFKGLPMLPAIQASDIEDEPFSSQQN